ncbi:InlB B-repeat-containing protein [Culicoidibacter larvae]|uniref:LPXTG cell wall anchor domain-containing protein n=1 Tax=Culicoidibacter larvae TaxID=2579976 RepID=A0A5R8QGV9_9FIRM|nr:InlB B-repeat-containing protein [Culicoidibacter larvae]TLG77228.1 LPXTG cell wall anchor domain-containing protein [Culicoidibacter larvae]
MKKLVYSFFALTLFAVSFFSLPVQAANDEFKVISDYAGQEVESTRGLDRDVETNLLTDALGVDLVDVQQGTGLYQLTSIEVARYRQKVRIEYYLGDYTQSTFIGADEGYADYYDSVSDYVMNVATVNQTFGQTIPTTYKLVPYSATDRSVYSDVPAYDGTDSTYTVKVLVAEVKRYNVSAKKYQNRQDLPAQPNPVGKSRTDIEALTEYWQVNSLSTNFNAVVGQEIDFKSVGQFSDTYTSSARVGQLAYYGMYDAAGNFTETSKFVVPADLSGTVLLAGFYAVDDLGSPAVKPGNSSSMTGGASIGFTGSVPTWKNARISETLDLTDAAAKAKLSAYPFHAAEDPFDAPEYPSYWWTPANFALEHRIELTYNYALVGTAAVTFTVDFESNGGTAVASLLDIADGATIIAPTAPTRDGFTFAGWYTDAALTTLWNFNSDIVTSDMTLYAKWTPTDSSDSNSSLPVTGQSDAWLIQIALGGLAIAAAGTLLLRKRK